LNYLYAILEAEARIAALAVGLDPVLGLLHADQRNRDSLAADLMEPVRPTVDAFLLDFLNRHTFTKADVYELLDGQCRLLPPLTEQLARTAPLWARRVMPVAQELALKLLEDERASRGKTETRQRRGQQVVVREYRPRLESEQDPVVPISPGVREALLEARKQQKAIGTRWVFPSDQDPTHPTKRELFAPPGLEPGLS
jgi:hypothetical protein